MAQFNSPVWSERSKRTTGTENPYIHLALQGRFSVYIVPLLLAIPHYAAPS